MNQYLKDLTFKDPTNLEFIKRLTTPTGIMQHTKFAVPDRLHGYCVDDNARALLLSVKDYQLFGKHQALNLAVVYLSYLDHSKTEDGWFHTYQTFDHQFKPQKDQDAYGRAIWALGYAIHANVRWDITKGAESVFNDVKDNLLKLEPPKAIAYSLLGCLYFQQSESKNDEMEKITQALTDKLFNLYEKTATALWPWFEPQLTYDNALLPYAMFKSWGYFKKDSYLRVAVESLGFLESQSHHEGLPSPVGSNGWYPEGSSRATWDQQPIDAASMVLANAEAYRVTRSENYKSSALDWFSWFYGNNLKKIVVCDPQSGGCFDGLAEDGINMNQGAESTLVYWLAYLELVDLFDSSK
jgi:hypothetical protein